MKQELYIGEVADDFNDDIVLDEIVDEAVVMDAEIIDEGEAGNKLPKGARRNEDGSITLALMYPVEVQIRDQSGKVRGERYDSLTFHHLTGVNIQAVMMDAVSKGINPLEAVIQKVQVLTGVSQAQINKYMGQAKQQGLEGADALGFLRQQLEKIGAAGKITELFNDQTVLEFLIPMLANVDEYLEIKEQVAKATGAMTDADFETQMQGVNRQMVILSELGEQFSREWGLTFGGWLPMVNDWLTSLLSAFREWDAATGDLLKQALSFGAGLVLMAVGLGAVGLVLPLVMAGFGALAGVVGLVLLPIGLVVALLAGAGVMIWQNWDKVAPKLRSFWNGI